MSEGSGGECEIFYGIGDSYQLSYKSAPGVTVTKNTGDDKKYQVRMERGRRNISGSDGGVQITCIQGVLC